MSPKNCSLPLRVALGALLAFFAPLFILAAEKEAAVRAPKNVIVMINDGASWGTWDAAAYWQYGSREGLPYADFPARYGMTTFPLNPHREPQHNDISEVGYDPEQAWDTTPIDDETLPFAGYKYLDRMPTDSAASGTALSSGVKTYYTAVNYDNFGQPVEFSTLVAKRTGRATGVVTSVPFPNATPATFAAHSPGRNSYLEIAHQMLSGGHLDLIMGTAGTRVGYDNNGRPYGPVTAEQWEEIRKRSGGLQVSDADWELLVSGNFLADGATQPWHLIRERADFEALAAGQIVTNAPLIGIPNVATTLQRERSREVLGADEGTPSGIAYINTVPTLATMTRGALRHLARRSDVGFFVMIEGGATDWAAHSSYLPEPAYGQLLEETVDFNNSVAAVIEWVEANSSWDETLLIITTDHGNSLVLGPDADHVPFQPVKNNGKGKLPGFTFRRTGHHTNELVALWAKGAGAEQFARRVRGIDPHYAERVGWNDGQYVDNSDVGAVVIALLQGRQVEKLEE